MKINLMTIIIIFLSFFSLINCSANLQKEQKATNVKRQDNDTQKSNYPNLVGKWNIFETKKGNGNKMCGNRPCGIPSYAEIFLENEKLKGKMSMGFNSMASPPRITDWAEIVIDIPNGNNENFVMTYQTTMNCIKKITVNEVSENKFFGTFDAKNCNINGKLVNLQGDFTAVKIIDEKN
jgi:hypothetical protein